MTRTAVRHACGHWETHQITGNPDRREWIAERLADRYCEDCFRERLAAERRAERDQAREATASLPELVGTEAQVDWAVVIRHKSITRMSERRYSSRRGEDFVAHESWEPLYRLIADALGQITLSRWWIDERDHLDGTLGDVLIAIGGEGKRSHETLVRPLWQQTVTLAFPDQQSSGTWLYDTYVPMPHRWEDPLASPLAEAVDRR